MSPRSAGGRARLTTRGHSVGLCGLVLLATGLVLGMGDLVRLGLLLLAALAGSWLLVGPRAGTAAPTRRVLPPAPTVGDDVAVVVAWRGPGPRGAALAAERSPDGALATIPLIGLRAGEEAQMRYRFTARRRGPQRLGPATADRVDGLGLWRTHRPVGEPDVVLVHPRTHPLVGAPGRGQPGSSRSGGPGGAGLHGLDDAVVRPYREGDEPRRIHWRATARIGELMVRQEDRPAAARTTVVLDTRGDAHTGDTFEWAVSAAASVLAHLDSPRHPAALVLPGAAPVPAAAAADALARVTTGRRGVLPDLPRATSVVAVLGARADDAVLAALDRCAPTRVALVVAPPGDADAVALGDALAARGWSVAVADPARPVPLAWADAVARPLTAGAPR